MDERIDEQELELDQAIDASRGSSVGHDAGSIEDTVDQLRTFTTSGPPVEPGRIRRSIEERLDHTPQYRPWWTPRWGRQPSLGTVSRKLLTAGAVAVIAVTISIGSLLTTSGRASAAFLENVEELAALTATATDDGVIDDDESAAIAALVEQLRARATHESLRELDPTELASAIQLLNSIGQTLDDHEHGDDGISEVTRAVVALIDHDERNDHQADDEQEDSEHGDADTTFTDAEIAASLAALSQLELDIDQLKLEADDALAGMIAQLTVRESEIGTAKAEALLRVAAIADLPSLDGLSDEELKDLLAQIGIAGVESEGDHNEDDDRKDGKHEDDDEQEDDDRSDHRLDGSDPNRLASALVSQFFQSPNRGTGDLLRELDRTFNSIERDAKELTKPFNEEFRYSQDDANALLDDLEGYLHSLEAEARLASAALQSELKAARDSVQMALEAKIGDLLTALDELDGEHDGEKHDDQQDGDEKDGDQKDDQHDGDDGDDGKSDDEHDGDHDEDRDDKPDKDRSDSHEQDDRRGDREGDD